ncbi:MAG: alpha-hydroxy acid oxidase [Acidimicrobiia bacterium]
MTRPTVDVSSLHHVDEFEAIARSVLPPDIYGYVAGGAGTERTVARNRLALDRMLLLPRVMRDMRTIDTRTTVLGSTVDHPLLLAPSAMQRLAHPEGEIATARAARDRGLVMVLSMNSSTTVEEVCAVGSECWMQLYVSNDRGHVETIVERAVGAGVRALCVTVDHAGMPTRLRELERPLVIPPDLHFVHLAADLSGRGVDRSFDWKSLDWLRGISDIPIVLKGVLHPEDARIAVDSGVDGIVVSNHGGRQLDGAVAPYDVLPAVLDIVGDSAEVYADGGIRSGSDLLKVLALGARAGLIGRPVWWGLATAGEEGVGRVLDIILDDFTEAMRLCGVRDIHEVSRDLLWSG